METTIFNQKDLQLREVVRDIETSNNFQTSINSGNDRIRIVELSQVSIHPKVKEVYIDKNTDGLKYTIKHVGQLSFLLQAE